MVFKIKNVYPIITAIAFSLLLSACGGGGSEDSIVTPVAAPVTPSATISGAVAGTTILAIDSQDDIVASDDTAGKAAFDVDTDGDGFADAFSLRTSEAVS